MAWVMPRRLALIAAATVAGSILTGCGGTPDRVSSPAPTADMTTARPATTTTATDAPLSPFEDQAPVKVARALFAAQARAVNRRSLASPQLAALLTPAGQHLLDPAVRSDFGLRYPGPVPFTPTRVVPDGRSATVLGCMVGHGFALDAKTGKPAGKRKVYPIKLTLVRASGAWKVDSLFLDSSKSCRGVAVPGIKW